MSRRLTIGLLVSGIADTFTVAVCRGAMRAAKEKDIKLVIFPGKYLDRDFTERKEIMYEYQYNTLFSYAEGDRLDAVLISADSIGCYTSSQRIRDMVEHYIHIPCVLIASKIEGYVSVNYDNYNGIKEAMDYLIHELGITRIGMIGGSNDNTDARERKESYLNILSENNIHFEEQWFAEGNLSHYAKSVFEKYVDTNPDIEAVFCVNDYTALGLYDALKKKHIMPGRDVMIFGYDNMLLASKMTPPLSSVWTDPVQLGERAINTVLMMVEGRHMDEQVLPTKFIRRESFGKMQSQNQLQTDRRLDRKYIDYYFDDIFYRYRSETDIDSLEAARNAYRILMGHIIGEYERGTTIDSQKNMIMNLLDLFLEYGVLEYADIENLLTHMEHIYNAFRCKEDGHWDKLEKTIAATYRKVIVEIEQHFGKILSYKEDRQFSMKMFVSDIMQFEKGIDQSYAVLLEHLKWLNIKNAYLYVFEKPIVHLEKEEFFVPDEMYLKAVLSDGNVESVLSVHQMVRSSDIFKNHIDEKSGNVMVTLPLFSNEMLYGVLLCDMTEELFENGEFLTNQIGAAIKMLELLKSNEQIQRQLEESLITLKENNIALDTLSKSDVLTGIKNRRGFYDAAQKLLDKNRDKNFCTLVAYVDMNNLKIINDRYGHDEGDFSIKLISNILTEKASDGGVVGRLGGDEFAIMVTVEDTKSETEFVKDVYESFNSYNEMSDKPYNVTVSVGTCILEKNTSLTLNEALTLADGKLYEEKQHRVKSVAKQVI